MRQTCVLSFLIRLISLVCRLKGVIKTDGCVSAVKTDGCVSLLPTRLLSHSSLSHSSLLPALLLSPSNLALVC
jgi:hypothetical protein